MLRQLRGERRRVVVIEWSADLAVGHAGIDAQHQELFRRIASLSDALDAGDRSEIGPLFDFLRGYVVDHFAAEEQAMREIGFPGYTVHRGVHVRFVREYQELRALYETAGPTSAVALRTRTWLVDWLVEHITYADRAFARHLAFVTAPRPTPAPLGPALRR
jgi:hemerythrin